MTDRREFLASLGAAALTAGAPLTSRAESAWPSARPITYVVPFFAGSSADVVGRLMAQKLGAALHQSFVVDNKAGAGGSIGASAVARAAPDGYTLLGGTSGTQAANATLYRSLPYDPVKDFEPVALIGSVPSVLVVSPSLGVNTVGELIALMKKDEQHRTFGSAGAGTSPHLAGELFSETIGVPLTHVAYKGQPAILDVAGGRLTFMFDQLGTTLPMVQSGKVKALAVSSPKRVNALPKVPTMIESGVAGFTVMSWHAIFAPKGTPKAIVDRLNAEVKKAVRAPDAAAALDSIGLQVATSTPAELGALVAREIPRWGEVIRKSGATLD
ncbi:tripartite tricarboxylate transporter substrate binding protein [Ramlibacter sp. G-1-2-2]|uniref:Tripartite tricarboxylate transporter substrate binding protein n=1 Tax=Ramlibacter agri TaxID=2728837 RepID=A0A848GXV2_9BURK|nr:tripartite tricarboxylate transporter substrate binding protein [Ramlibacter agri]NML42251.1 tripartite tricarboxylate transporter substrate binding protein [Ramlibacter agri]